MKREVLIGENCCKQIIERLFKLLLKLISHADKNVSDVCHAQWHDIEKANAVLYQYGLNNFKKFQRFLMNFPFFEFPSPVLEYLKGAQTRYSGMRYFGHVSYKITFKLTAKTSK